MSNSIIAKDTNGIGYTADDFNLGSVPKGTVFDSLDLRGTSVYRVPAIFLRVT